MEISSVNRMLYRRYLHLHTSGVKRRIDLPYHMRIKVKFVLRPSFLSFFGTFPYLPDGFSDWNLIQCHPEQ